MVPIHPGADSYKNRIPGRPDVSMLHPFIQNLKKGNRHFLTADNRKYVEANNRVSESLFYSLKKPLQWVIVCCKTTKNTYIWLHNLQT